MTNLTIAFITCRKDPKIDWFFESLDRQIVNNSRPRIVVVDFWKEERPLEVRGSIHVTPKPNMWQGPHRKTKENWFAAANARNTGLCYATDGFIAYVDDLSVLGERWAEEARNAIKGNYIACGAYQKAKNMVVESGMLKSCDVCGRDNRWRGDDVATPCGGDWMYGCSLVAPVEALLSVNGWPEWADGMGFEDVLMGFTLSNAGFPLRYAPRLFTTESEDDHFGEQSAFKRSDYGQSPQDKSHDALYRAQRSKHNDNPSIPGGIREMRAKALRGETLPVPDEPKVEWYTKTPLESL